MCHLLSLSCVHFEKGKALLALYLWISPVNHKNASHHIQLNGRTQPLYILVYKQLFGISAIVLNLISVSSVFILYLISSEAVSKRLVNLLTVTL